jgi:metallo-beta-lactamase class B
VKSVAAYLGLGSVGAFIAAALVGVATPPVAAAADTDDPLTRPIAADFAKRWLTAQKPVRIYGNTYIVGFGGLNVALIKTDAGLIMIDGAVPQSVAALEANVRTLGFKVADIKYILSTEPHYDHGGGLAALSRDSGAAVIASAAGAEVLRRGKSGPDDPQASILSEFPPVTRLRAVKDGETIRLGATVITARATPGHTAGSMSWTWQSCEGGKCLNMVFASSLNPVSGDDYRFTDHPAWVATFRSTVGVVAALPCDILFTAHPDQGGGDVKMAAFQRGVTPNPFVDPGACRAYVAKFDAVMDARLAKEAVK